MGCTESKIDNEETIILCKDRKDYIQRAVVARNKFAAAHSAHAMSLKNAGACLNEFAHGQVLFTSSAAVPTSVSSAVASPPPLPYENFIIPPPPPLPAKYNTSLQRASTMPEFSIPKSDDRHSDPIIEEVNEDDTETEIVHGLKHRRRKSGERAEISSSHVIAGEIMRQHRKSDLHEQQMKNPLAESKDEWDFLFPMENVSMPSLSVEEDNHLEREEMERRVLDERGKKFEIDNEKELEMMQQMTNELPPQPPPLREEASAATKVVKNARLIVPPQVKKNSGGSNLNLVQIFIDMDDCFLKASESAHEVSKMLEATRLHYHSNFADKSGHINHAERVMRVITWNKSVQGSGNASDARDDLDAEEHETHATVLDKLLAWEKKLYNEVKAGEQLKFEYQKKVKQLNKLKQHGSNMEALERTKAAVSYLNARYVVDMQSLEATISEINRLRDEQLYPKLVALIDGMAKMWETMGLHHENQCKIVEALRLLGDSQSLKETSDHHFERTRELGNVIQDWHANISEFMAQQREYIRAINSWLKLNLVPIDISLQEKASSPGRTPNPPIHKLVQAWNGYLERIPDESANSAILNFAATIQAIWEYQKEEMDFRKRCADSRKDLVKKTRDFGNWYNKYSQRRTPPDEMDPDRAGDKDLQTRRQMVEAATQKSESDEKAYQNHCIQVRQKSLTSLKNRLPVLFKALSSFSLACSDMYSNLRAIAHRQGREEI